MLRRLLIVFCLLIVPAISRGEEKSVKITKSEPEVTERRFDPTRPPSDMPPLHGNEAAVTVSNFSMETNAGGRVMSKTENYRGVEADVQITSIEFKPRLRITVYLPYNATKKLVDHENGHRKIAEIYYDKLDEVARQLGGEVVGKRFQGRGNGTDGATRDAIQRAIKSVNGPLMDRVESVCNKVQERYDKITDHGRDPIAVPDAIKRSIEEIDNRRP